LSTRKKKVRKVGGGRNSRVERTTRKSKRGPWDLRRCDCFSEVQRGEKNDVLRRKNR